MTHQQNIQIIQGLLADMESDSPILDPTIPKQQEISDLLRSLCYKVLQMRGNQQRQAAEVLVGNLIDYTQKRKNKGEL